MSEREVERPQVRERVCAGTIRQRQAAVQLGLSERQVDAVLKTRHPQEQWRPGPDHPDAALPPRRTQGLNHRGP